MPNQQYSTSNDTLDPQLIKHGDKRNVIDHFDRTNRADFWQRKEWHFGGVAPTCSRHGPN